MAETLPPQPRLRRGKRKRAKIFTPSEANGFPSGPSPRPPSFLPFCFNARRAGAAAALRKEKRIVALDPPNPFAGDIKELPIKLILTNMFSTYSIQQSIAFLTNSPSFPINPFFFLSFLFKAFSSIFFIFPTFNSFIFNPQNKEYKS